MLKFLVALIIASTLLPAVLWADNTSADNDKWVYSVTPYLWVTGQKGEVATLPPADTAEIDISFSDVISKMDFSMMGFFEARKGRFGLFGEIFYIGISADADTPGNLYSKADYEQDLWGLSLGGSYAMTQSDQYFLDAVTGIRFWDLDNSLKLKSDILPSTKTSHRERWQDLFVGVRGKRWLNDKWFISGWGITSIAGDSDSAWDIFGAIGYDYSDSISFSAGYRHQEVKYKDGDFLFDVKMSGPTLGASIRF